jgi:hypothetical protein
MAVKVAKMSFRIVLWTETDKLFEEILWKPEKLPWKLLLPKALSGK